MSSPFFSINDAKSIKALTSVLENWNEYKETLNDLRSNKPADKALTEKRISAIWCIGREKDYYNLIALLVERLGLKTTERAYTGAFSYFEKKPNEFPCLVISHNKKDRLIYFQLWFNANVSAQSTLDYALCRTAMKKLLLARKRSKNRVEIVRSALYM